jgi:TorA maturation chaperone TorD
MTKLTNNELNKYYYKLFDQLVDLNLKLLESYYTAKTSEEIENPLLEIKEFLEKYKMAEFIGIHPDNIMI